MRRIYPISIIINGRFITHVVIDPHYEQRHKESINDNIILELVRLLHGKEFEPERIKDDGCEYFAEDSLELHQKRYRLIWMLPPSDTYLGVINAFRRPS